MSAVQQLPETAVFLTEPRTTPRPRALNILTVITVLAVAAGLLMALVYAEQDAQGNVQRIFYIHMTSFFGAFVAFGGTVIGGVRYLQTRNVRWDTMALAGVEVGLALSLVNLATGSIWARPIWNTWWNWDPRLVSAAIMVLTYVAYLMLRNSIENPDTRRRFASVYGILAITTVILTLVIIRIRPDTIHPAVIGASPQNAEGTPGLTDTMLVTMLVHLFVWGTLVPVTLMWYRVRLQNLAERVNALKAELLQQER